MTTLILMTPANARTICAALDAADPVGAPYVPLRQLSETDERLDALCVHLAWGQTGLQGRLGAAARAAGATVLTVPDRADAELARRGLRFRPELPEERPTRHADIDAVDQRRGIVTTGTIAERWAQHEERSRRVDAEPDSTAVSR